MGRPEEKATKAAGPSADDPAIRCPCIVICAVCCCTRAMQHPALTQRVLLCPLYVRCPVPRSCTSHRTRTAPHLRFVPRRPVLYYSMRCPVCDLYQAVCGWYQVRVCSRSARADLGSAAMLARRGHFRAGEEHCRRAQDQDRTPRPGY
eukprot:3071368-Rhodomonas_salina.1